MNTHTHSLSSAIIQENTIAQYKGRGNSLNNESARIIYYTTLQVYNALQVDLETPSFILSQFNNFSHLRVITKISSPKSDGRAPARTSNQTSQPNLVPTGGRPHPSHPSFISAQWVGDLTQVPFSTSAFSLAQWAGAHPSYPRHPRLLLCMAGSPKLPPFCFTRWVGDSPESPPALLVRTTGAPTRALTQHPSLLCDHRALLPENGRIDLRLLSAF